MKRAILYSLLVSVITGMTASEPFHVKLYPDGVPSRNGLENTPESITEKGYYTNVSDPELIVYLPAKDKATGQAMLVVPGGSYKNVCTPREGIKTAEWLNNEGIAAVELKYRAPNGHPEIPLEDGMQAMKMLKANASKWGINPDNIGIIGFSAGGHFASNLITRYPDEESRPRFAVLVYPVITMKFSNANTRENLLGEQSDDRQARKAYSTDNHVHQNVPETMLVLADNDRLVKPENSISFYNAMKQNKVKAEMHIFPDGGHGFWMKDKYNYANETYPLVMRWIKEHDLSTTTK